MVKSGAELLVERGYWRKVAAGSYTTLDQGERLQRNLAHVFMRACAGPNIKGIVTEVSRAALRPGPKQLVRFSVLTLTAPPAFSAEVRNGAFRLCELLLELGAQSRIRATDDGLQVVPIPPYTDACLRHTYATFQEPSTLTIGLDVVSIALAIKCKYWPDTIAPVECEIIPTRRHDKTLLNAITAVLASEGVAYAIASRSDSLRPAAPCTVILATGLLPIHVRTITRDVRLASEEEFAAFIRANTSLRGHESIFLGTLQGATRVAPAQIRESSNYRVPAEARETTSDLD